MKKLCIPLLCILLLCAPALPATAEPTASGLVNFAQEALGSGYIFGAYGQTNTARFRNGRAELYPQYAPLIQRFSAAWDGLPAYDCIGLFKAYILATGAQVAIRDINTTAAWALWVDAWGPLEGAQLAPGTALFRVEGPRMLVKHIGIYVGDGRVIHARGTRWGVVEDILPNVFTHWATLNWLEMDTAQDARAHVTGPFLPTGTLAVVESDSAGRVTVSSTPHEAGKVRPSMGYFADGTLVTVLAVPDEISRLVAGVGEDGRPMEGYVRLTELREAAQVGLLVREEAP